VAGLLRPLRHRKRPTFWSSGTASNNPIPGMPRAASPPFSNLRQLRKCVSDANRPRGCARRSRQIVIKEGPQRVLGLSGARSTNNGQPLRLLSPAKAAILCPHRTRYEIPRAKVFDADQHRPHPQKYPRLEQSFVIDLSR
jgi:hypothetical protein